MQYCMNKELTLNEELLSLMRFFLFFCVNPTQIQEPRGAAVWKGKVQSMIVYDLNLYKYLLYAKLKAKMHSG